MADVEGNERVVSPLSPNEIVRGVGHMEYLVLLVVILVLIKDSGFSAKK